MDLNQSGAGALLPVQSPGVGVGIRLPVSRTKLKLACTVAPSESAHVTTTIDTRHPLLNTNAERMRIEAMLRHLGSGADLRDLPVSASEKVALVKTANQRGLIAWHKSRGRYELTAAGWCELAPSRRFGVGSVMVGTTIGASLGAVALAVFWLTAGAAHAPAPGSRVATAHAPAQVAKLSAPAIKGAVSDPAVTGAVSDPAGVASASSPAEPAAASAEPPGSAPASPPVREAASTPPPVEAQPSKVAEEPASEQAAEPAKAKHAAAKKTRQRAAARRRREEAARAWAAREPSRTREAEYSGHGVYGGYGYGGYGGGNSWFAYR